MADQSDASYERFEASSLIAQQMVKGAPYLEFMRHESMSAGLYVLDAGGEDQQRPHAEDELYHVLEGQAVLEVDGDQRPVKAGSTIFVAAGTPHRFHSIAAKLTVLVVFAPPETPPADTPGG